jgi:hypothetical protein
MYFSPVVNTDLALGWGHVPGVPASFDRKTQGGERAPGRTQRHYTVRVTTEKSKNSCILVGVCSQPVASLYILLPEDPDPEASLNELPVDG